MQQAGRKRKRTEDKVDLLRRMRRRDKSACTSPWAGRSDGDAAAGGCDRARERERESCIIWFVLLFRVQADFRARASLAFLSIGWAHLAYNRLGSVFFKNSSNLQI